jgi:hypothetical protein
LSDYNKKRLYKALESARESITTIEQFLDKLEDPTPVVAATEDLPVKEVVSGE